MGVDARLLLGGIAFLAQCRFSLLQSRKSRPIAIFSIYGICFAFFHKKSLPKNDIIHIVFKIFDKIFILVLTKSDMRCIMCANKLKGKPSMRRTLNFAYAFYYYFYDRSNRIL